MGAFGCIVLLILAILSPFAKANSESDALNAFKNVLKDPNNVLASWDTTLVDPCTWFHVTCDADNFVTRVLLNDNKLSGPVPKEISALPSLKVVDLSNNNLCGPIPTTRPFEGISFNNSPNC
ncbi:hypothetical protein Leryth_001219 [Lithospermum erythrorhizon]|nr:hypothetical protein Leryth_001219 [Lithospermum erythrorhizon]